MSDGRGEGARDVSAGAGAGTTGVGFAGVVAEPAGEVTTVDVDVDEATASVSAAFSVFTAHAVTANRNAMERRIEGIEVNGSFEIEVIIVRGAQVLMQGGYFNCYELRANG